MQWREHVPGVDFGKVPETSAKPGKTKILSPHPIAEITFHFLINY
jgi:hypothetical protein